MSQLPNILTLFRIGLVPVLILVLKEHEYLTALAIFTAAGLTDGLDGFIAKRFNCTSQLGAILDPLADKLLPVSAYVMLVLLGDIPFWLLLAVAFRDLLIVGGYLVYVSLRGSVRMQPSYLSKFNTLMQITLVVVVLGLRAFDYQLQLLVDGLVAMVLTTTVASGGHYLWKWLVRGEVETASGGGGGG